MDHQALLCTPIGRFQGKATKPYHLCRQPGMEPNEGVITLEPHCNFEQALEDLWGFDRIWVLFWLHQGTHWRPKVRPPRGEKKRGLFATRSPHRPNPIGLSCVKLEKIQGRQLWIREHDLLHGTPILDLKPYLAYSDAYPQAAQGWLEELGEEVVYELVWSEKAEEQRTDLEGRGEEVRSQLQARLSRDPFPGPSRRIQELGEERFLWACGKLRVRYLVEKKEKRVWIEEVKTL